ncbi:MAG TPA: sigma-70 family RNA polymerase sigma factor [Cyclobacteriaceae bacterium]|nr:sigma-70 family RNA polymerase sigma factor [Cyclobacteriaceae bacterium]
MKEEELIPHLFRTEFRKITTVLCRHFGIEHIEMAEDIASETFLSAMESWAYKGLPENPVAWLYTTAKNKAKNHARRIRLFDEKISPSFHDTTDISTGAEIDLSEKNISDSQLQMMFAICHPAIPEEAQISLSLRILCGFGVEEIANAFLTSKETVNKRLFRAKEKLRVEKVPIEFPAPDEIDKRMSTVLTSLYLLYNEGYYSESRDLIVREDLCREAMRLVYLLIENEKTNRAEVNALYALMCFHASRFAARKNESGEMILYKDQDESLWDRELIAKGSWHLHQASQGEKLSKYHLEAGIAYWHTIKEDTPEKWESILQLFNQLLRIEYSPIIALNRTYALSKANGKREAIVEAEKLKLMDNPFYFALLGEIYTDVDNTKAKMNFELAFQLAKTKSDRKIIQKKLNELG